MINAGLDRGGLLRFTFSRSLFFGRLGAGFLFKVLLYGVKDAVDKLRGFVCGKAPGYLQCFIDNDSVRRRLEKELVDGKPEDVPVDHRHALDAPMFGPGPDLAVNFGEPTQRPEHEIVRELACRQIYLPTELPPEIVDQTRPAHPGHIRGKKHL